jgi:hypothetical protein
MTYIDACSDCWGRRPDGKELQKRVMSPFVGGISIGIASDLFRRLCLGFLFGASALTAASLACRDVQ